LSFGTFERLSAEANAHSRQQLVWEAHEALKDGLLALAKIGEYVIEPELHPSLYTKRPGPRRPGSGIVIPKQGQRTRRKKSE
jgi:hypothetical protein